MKLKEIELRLKEIKEVELIKDNADVETLEKEINSLLEERKKILENGEKRNALLDKLASGESDIVIRTFKEEEIEPVGYDSPVYRTAFLKQMLGQDLTKQERTAYTHTTANTGAVLPKEIINKIYSNMEEQHPLLADINIIRSNTVISIVRHKSITAGDAKEVAEATANDDENNAFGEITLTGKDFVKSVKYSYRLKNMAIPAFETYLINEIGQRITSVWAKSIVTKIDSDLNSDNKITTAKQKIEISDILGALSKLKGTSGNIVVYANSATIYGELAQMKDVDSKLSFITDYSKNISGSLLGKAIKQEDALEDKKILILDPTQYTENVVQDLMIESDKDISTHTYILSGILTAGGTMTNDKGGVMLTIQP